MFAEQSDPVEPLTKDKGSVEKETGDVAASPA
jgi:hypothetical protein